MTRDEAARFLRSKLSVSRTRQLHVFLTWTEVREIIILLERKDKVAKIPVKERIGVEEKNKGTQRDCV